DILRIGRHERHGCAVKVVDRWDVDHMQARQMRTVSHGKAGRELHSHGAARRAVEMHQNVLQRHRPSPLLVTASLRPIVCRANRCVDLDQTPASRAGVRWNYCNGTRKLSPGVWIDRLSSLVSNFEPGV